ncbi:MAG: hypothetical protein H0U10_08980 [Chloroflexia bacterium]|nr:hypothetical protein [Chloroflexia bacterium]
MREGPSFHLLPKGAVIRPWYAETRGLFQDKVGPRLIGFSCAVFLLFAVVAPREFARTTWVEGKRNGGGTRINDDPTGYVGLVTLCGLVALVALAVELWPRRWAVAGALVAAAAFAGGAWVTAVYWRGFSRGDRLLEGQEMLGSRATAHFPLLLPVFAFAALVGLVCALALVVHGWGRPDGG